MKILCLNCHPDLTYFYNRGLKMQIDNKDLSMIFPEKQLYSVIDADGQSVNMVIPDASKYLSKTYANSNYDIILVGFNSSDYSPKIVHTGGYTDPMKLVPSNTYYAIARNENNNYFIHEMHHAICLILNFKYNKDVKDFMDIDSQGRPYYLNDQPDNPLSNYAQTWEQIKPYLSILNNTNMATTKTYANFNPKSDPYMIGVSPLVMDIAQKVRTKTGLVMKLTSGLRTVAKNTQVGGVSNSSHLKGLALDFSVTNSTRQIFLNALINCGTPVFIEDCPDHIHFDIDSSIHKLGDMIISQNG